MEDYMAWVFMMICMVSQSITGTSSKIFKGLVEPKGKVYENQEKCHHDFSLFYLFLWIE